MGYNAFSPLAGAGGGLIWEWNGTDVSQFDAPILVSSGNVGTFAPGTIATTTGAVSPQPGGTRLQLPTTGGGVSGTHWAIWPISDPIPPSFILEINSDFANFSTGNEGPGICYWGDFSNPAQPYGYLFAPGGRTSRMDGSITSINGNSLGTNASPSGQQTYRIEGRSDDPTGPHGQLLATNEFATSIFRRILRGRYNANDGDYAFVANPAWGGNAAMNKVGLCVFSTGGGGAAPTWFINSVKIRSL